MAEEGTRALVRLVIAHAVGFYDARTKGLTKRLEELGFNSHKGQYTQGAIGNWKARGTGISSDLFLALARDMKLDLNALVYRGEIATYDPGRDIEAVTRDLREAVLKARRVLGDEVAES